MLHSGTKMHIGILGGGLQGCCLALAFAEYGKKVTLYDKNERLISRAGASNEGKIHLGYMYANDPTLRTARIMARGALAFEAFITRFLSGSSRAFETSSPAAYVVHRNSQRSREEFADFIRNAHDCVVQEAAGRQPSYFGQNLHQPPRRWTRSELETEFDGRIAVEAYDTCEVAINPMALAEELGNCVINHPRIDVQLSCAIESAANNGSSVTVVGTRDGQRFTTRFDHVVNALWDGRLALDKAYGLKIDRPWIHRLKYGVSMRLSDDDIMPRSATFVSGPFGEVVSYPRGLIYLTWYPVCLRELTRALTPPEWPNLVEGTLREQIVSGTVSQMSEFVLALRNLRPETLTDASVKGGAIVAVGETDIYDPKSELHNRYEIGITSDNRYHSVDPGKLTMAPYFAQQLADQICSA
jgi:hypothetical protein